jgi:hypothetical protein
MVFYLVRLSEKSNPCNIYAKYSYKIMKPIALHNVRMHKNTENP